MNLVLIIFHFKDFHIFSPLSLQWVEREINILSEVSVQYMPCHFVEFQATFVC